MEAVANIKKITKAMKMVSSAHSSTRARFPRTPSASLRLPFFFLYLQLVFYVSSLSAHRLLLCRLLLLCQVASAKLKRCEDALKVSRNFSKGILELWGPEEAADPAAAASAEGGGVPKPTTQASSAQATAAVEGAEGKQAIPNSVLVVPITPDRGLCGSVSAQVARATKHRVSALHKQDKKVLLAVYGEKGRASLERNFSADFTATIADHSKLKRRTFKQTALMANAIVSVPFESAEVVYNQFKNMITFENRNVRLASFAQATADPKLFEPYEVEGNPDALENLYDFTTAVRLHLWLAECDMVEFSQRVNSMGNSSKSAEDMLARLKLLYNRTRQAKITTELVEIISGAAAADDQKKEE